MYDSSEITQGMEQRIELSSELLYSGAGDIGTERPGLNYMLIRKTC